MLQETEIVLIFVRQYYIDIYIYIYNDYQSLKNGLHPAQIVQGKPSIVSIAYVLKKIYFHFNLGDT
jgi:hypothetical protein